MLTDKKFVLMAAGAGVLLVIAVVAMILIAFRSYDLPYEIIEMGSYDDIHYVDDGLFLVERGREWGIKDYLGEWIIPFGSYAQFREVHENYFSVFDNGAVIILDRRGRERATFEGYDAVQIAAADRFIVNRGDDHAVVNRRGREIIAAGLYDTIIPAPGGLFVVRDADTRFWGVINQRRAVLPIEFDSISVAGEIGFVMTQGPDIWVMTDGGSDRIPPGRFDEIWYDAYRHFQVARLDETGRQTGIADRHGEEAVPVGRYDFAATAGHDRFIVRTGEIWDLRTGVLDRRGSEIVPMGYFDEIFYMDGGLFILHEGRGGFFSTDGEEIIPFGRYEHIHGVFGNFAIVTSGGQIGVVNIDLIHAQ